MIINFTYAQGVSQAQMAAFEVAGSIWSSYLTDNVIINIAVDVQKDFVGNTVAGAIARSNTIGFPTFKSALLSDSSSAVDRLAATTANVKGGDVSARLNQYDEKLQQFKDLSKNGSNIQINSANAKAIGKDIIGGQLILDGYVVMRDLTGTNTNWHYDLTRSVLPPANSIDFISVAVHEIGHVLGFQSSVDQPWFDPFTNTATYNKNLSGRVNLSTPLDLFRYSDKAGTGQTDLAQGGIPYLSVSAGIISGYFQTGTNTSLGGNGKQASHWQSGGIMDAEIQRGNRPAITTLDLTAFDAIGWNIDPQGVNKVINYSQIAAAAQQVAALKITQNISTAMALMLDKSDVYKVKDATSVGTYDARTGGWWQEFFARTGGWWQEYFARTGGWWQGIKGAFGEEAVFDSIEGEDIQVLNSLNTPSNDRSNELTNTNAANPLTGKNESAIVVGDAIAQRQFFDSPNLRNDFEFSQSYSNSQKIAVAVLDQQNTNKNVEFTYITEALTFKGTGDRNSFNLSSVISNNFQLTDNNTFTPLVRSDWWLS